MTVNQISEESIRAVFDQAAKLLPGTKYVVCKLDDNLDFSGYFQKKGYNYTVLFYFPLDENIWDGYTEERMAKLQTRCFPAAKRLGDYVEKLCSETGIPFERPPIGKDHMTPPYITPLSVKAVGTKGGAGWIGKSDLLVTFEYGPKITTMGAVFYADDYTVGTPVTQSRCGSCHRCVDACPWHNIYGNTWHEGVTRDELVDYHGCSVSRYLASNSNNVDIPGVGKKVACCGCMMACPVGIKNVLAVIDSI
jgi:epoxyqueuosine reductase QueG